jgi:hypothetical protein
VSGLQSCGDHAEAAAGALSQQNPLYFSALSVAGGASACLDGGRSQRSGGSAGEVLANARRDVQNQAHVKDKDLHRYAAEIGLDMARYTAEMDDHIYLQKVREHIEGARRSHIRATPTFFVDGVVQDISFGMKALHDAVANAVGRGA